MPGSAALFSFGIGNCPPRSATASKHAAAHEALLGHVLDAERAEAGRTDAFVAEKAAVVIEHTFGRDDADMPGAIELRADLAELGCYVLVVIDELLAAKGTAGRHAGDEQLPAAGAKRRRIGGVDFTEGRDLSLLHEAHRLQHKLKVSLGSERRPCRQHPTRSATISRACVAALASVIAIPVASRKRSLIVSSLRKARTLSNSFETRRRQQPMS